MAAPLISFRTDASLDIGSGHVVRCLTLADALRDAGARCRFVCRAQPGDWIERIAARGHAVQALPAATDDFAPADREPAHAAWLGARWPDDAAQTLTALAGETSDWLVVDHYALDARWEAALRPAARRCLVIDDLADRPHDADLLLDQSVHADAERRYRRLVTGRCDLRLGPAHALLRPVFDTPPARPRDGRVQRVLAYFGGNDQHHLAGQALQALARFPQLQADLVLGADHPQRQALLAERVPNVQVHEFHPDLPAAMAAADLALGCCGMAAWERCAMGLPSLVCVNADNQRGDTAALQALGALRSLGEAAALSADDWAAALDQALADPAGVAAMARAAAAVVAGHAAHRRQLLDLLLGAAEPRDHHA